MKKALVILIIVMLATALLHASSYSKGNRKIKLVTREVSLGKRHSGIVRYSLVAMRPDVAVSPNSKRAAYEVARGDKRFVVVDGEEGKEYDEIWGLLFSPDSKRVTYKAEHSGKKLFVVDSEEGKEYDDLLSKLAFDSPKLFHTLAVQGNEFFCVEVEIVEE